MISTSYGSRLNPAQEVDAARTGIAFGWETRSLLLNRPAVLAACERCAGLFARCEIAAHEFSDPARKAEAEFRAWTAFKVQALTACCEHLLDYLATKSSFVLPSVAVESYGAALALDVDRVRCELLGIAFGSTREGGFVAGCERCAYVHRVKPVDMPEDATVAVAIMRSQMSLAAVKKTCAHWFRWAKVDAEMKVAAKMKT